MCALVCACASDQALAQDVAREQKTSTRMQTAWMPDTSSWPEAMTQMRAMSMRPPLSGQGVVWSATRCAIDEAGRLRSCEGFSREDGERVFMAERITWRDEDDTPELAEGVSFEWNALAVVAEELADTTSELMLVSVRVTHDDEALSLSSTSSLARADIYIFEGPTWHAQDGEVVSEAATARLEAKGSWVIDALRYGAWIRRAELDTSSHRGPTRGVLPPRVLVVDGEVMVGAEAVVAAPRERALFAGAFAAPQSSSFGASLGLGGPEGDDEIPVKSAPIPLRLQVGVDQGEVEASLHGETMLQWGTHDHVALHAEQGHRPWVDRSVIAESGAIRPWRQSRAGLSLGSEETVLQATGIHQPEQSWWGAYVMAGGRYRLRPNAGVDFAVSHHSHIVTGQAQDHRTEVTPGWYARWGRRDRMYASMFAGLGIAQQSIEEMDTTGIATANRMAALGVAEWGASLEGRGAKVRHRIEPRVSAYFTPLSWSRRPTRTEDEDQTRAVQTRSEVQLGGTARLDQALTDVDGRMGLEFPVTALAWQSVAQDESSAPDIALMGDARLFYVTADRRLRFDAGGWSCAASACRGRRAAAGHVSIESPGNWGIDYVRGNLTAQMLTWRWLGHRGATSGSVNAGLWQDMFEEATSETRRTQVMSAHATWGIWGVSAMGYLQEGNAWGGMGRLSIEPSRTGWQVDAMMSLQHDDVGDRVWGLGLTWRE